MWCENADISTFSVVKYTYFSKNNCYIQCHKYNLLKYARIDVSAMNVVRLGMW